MNKNLLRQLQPYKSKAAVIVFLDCVLAVIIAARCYYLAVIVDEMLLSRLTWEAAVPQLALLLFLFTAEAGLGFAAKIIANNVSTDIRKNLRCAFFAELAGSSPLSSIYNTDLLQLVTRGIDSFDPYFSKFLPQLVTTVIMPLFILCIAFYHDWLSGLIFFLTLPLIPFFMMLIGKKAQLENTKQWKALLNLSEVFAELLAGLSVLKIYNQGKNQLKKTIKVSEDFSDSVLKVLRIAFLSAFFLELIATLSIAVIAVNIGLHLLSGQVHFLPMFFILLLAPEFYKPLRQTGSMFHEAMGALSNAEKIFNTLSSEKKISQKQSIKFDTAPIIRFSDVSFSYAKKREKALDKVNITFAAGKVTALVGRSGAGKSTIFSLLLGFAEPTSGHIYADDTDINSTDINFWRSNIAYVPQQAHIFNASFRENICLGRTVSEETLHQAIQAAGLSEVIEALPQGLNTIIGQGGRALSCGQARRLAMARAFVSEAPVLLLDEPMEGLDVITENIVRNGLRKMAVGKTVIIIAHRLASVQEADAVYVLSDGRVVEAGTDKVLRLKDGLYHRMWLSSEGESL